MMDASAAVSVILGSSQLGTPPKKKNAVKNSWSVGPRWTFRMVGTRALTNSPLGCLLPCLRQCRAFRVPLGTHTKKVRC